MALPPRGNIDIVGDADESALGCGLELGVDDVGPTAQEIRGDAGRGRRGSPGKVTALDAIFEEKEQLTRKAYWSDESRTSSAKVVLPMPPTPSIVRMAAFRNGEG